MKSPRRPPDPPASWVAQRLGSQKTVDTAPELRLRSALHRRGLRFRVHRRVLSTANRTHDLVFGPSHVVVDVHGCFWHGCPDHFVPPKHNADFWEEKIGTNRQRDADTTLRLNGAGWLLIVVWEHEDCDIAAERVARTVATRRPSP